MKSRSLEDVVVIAAPAVFVALWSSGFIGTKVGVLHAEPMSFLSLRMVSLVLLYFMIRRLAAMRVMSLICLSRRSPH